jgi:dihydropteroate synthase-like protein
MPERILFVTGKLAEPALRRMVTDLGAKMGFDPEVAVLGISVAALMTPDWVARRLELPEGVTRVMLPGWCSGNLSSVEVKSKVPVECGPKDLRDLPEHFGRTADAPPGYGEHDIEIIAEINHCPRLSWDEIIARARRNRADGADVIDIGCDPGGPWSGVTDVVRRLRDEGFRVSVDSFDRREIELATQAGAELVLSVNQSNVDGSRHWGAEVVVVPDEVAGATGSARVSLGSLDRTIEKLDAAGVRFRIDPVIEPIGFGFAASLGRYLEARRRWPRAEIMMGIGNLTELTDVDSAGVNAMLIGFCQELGIRSVLTTEVINWARSSVREVDLARRLVYHAVKHRVLPKHVESGLVMLRDAKVHEHGPAALAELARRITDPNFRIFAEGSEIHMINSSGHLSGTDPFDLFHQAVAANEIDASHAFYLGYEMAKAMTALTLGKDYRQDQALDWGFLTRPELGHRKNSTQTDQ